MVGDAEKMEEGSGLCADVNHFEGEPEEEDAAVVEGITRPEEASALTDLRLRDGDDLNESSGLIGSKGEVWSWKSDVLVDEGLGVADEKGYVVDFVASESQSESGSTGGALVRRYTRDVLEALRFVEVDEQQKRWNEIYSSLESVVSREYDEISANSQQKLNRHYDQRQQQEKKKETSTSKDEVLVKNGGKDSDALEILGVLYDSNFVEVSWAVEEETCDEDDSDDEYDSIRRPAFLVEGEPDFESGPPQDGWEYLRRVRWEAAQMPKVKVAKLDRSKWTSEQTAYMPNIPEIAKCPENLSPQKHWVDIFLADFSELRKAFSEFENSANRPLCQPTDEDFSEESPGLQMRKHIPTLSAILDMDPVSRAAMLRNWVKAFEGASVLSRDNCLWMFALCAAVDTPLDADMSSCLRCLLRKCCSLLSKKSEFDEEVAMLNILIMISGQYFGQSENGLGLHPVV